MPPEYLDEKHSATITMNSYVKALLNVRTPNSFAIVVLIVVQFIRRGRFFGLDRATCSIEIFHEL